MQAASSRPGEDALIARYFVPLAGPEGLGLKDDVALITPPPDHSLVATVDTIVAGVHFFSDDPPHTVGHKALAVNLSDLAAKGAQPAGFLLALALPSDWTEAWLNDFTRGLGALAHASACPLLGGDTTRAAGPLVISITAFGFVPDGTMVARTSAQPGDLIAVTGTIGDAAIGLKARLSPEADWVQKLGESELAFLLDRYLKPRPRYEASSAIRAVASCAMDVSDGLVGDCAKMLRASGVTGTLRLEDVPFSVAARAAIRFNPALRADAVTGGDDYEILFTCPRDRLDVVAAAFKHLSVSFAVIGEVRAGDTPLTVSHGGESFETQSGSYQHF
jgi:thiamine-monophosphate kinase